MSVTIELSRFDARYLHLILLMWRERLSALPGFPLDSLLEMLEVALDSYDVADEYDLTDFDKLFGEVHVPLEDDMNMNRG
jgi:hypothetical protein